VPQDGESLPAGQRLRPGMGGRRALGGGGELEDALVGERKHGGSGELGGGGGAQHTARAVSAAGGADRGFSAPSPRTLPRGSSHASASALPPLPEMPAELSAELPRDDGGGDDEAGGGGL